MAAQPALLDCGLDCLVWVVYAHVAPMDNPPPSPAGHNFCKPCLEKKFGHIADEIDAGAATGRSLRVRKVVKPCPTCKVRAPSCGWQTRKQ